MTMSTYLSIALGSAAAAACSAGPPGIELRGSLVALTSIAPTRDACRPDSATYDPAWRRGPLTKCVVAFGRDSLVSLTFDADTVVAAISVVRSNISPADSLVEFTRETRLVSAVLGPGSVCGARMVTWASGSVHAAVTVGPEQDALAPGTVLTFKVRRLVRLGALPDAFVCPER